MYRPEYIEEQIKDIEESGADVVYCAMLRHVDGNGTRSRIPARLEKGFINYQSFLIGTPVSTQLILGKKEVFKHIQFDPDMPRRQDWDLILRISQNYLVYYSDKVLVDVYLQDDSLTCSLHKGIKALQMIYDKNKSNIESDQSAYYFFHNTIADEKGRAKINPQYDYLEILKRKFYLKIFVKYIFAKINVYL